MDTQLLGQIFFQILLLILLVALFAIGIKQGIKKLKQMKNRAIHRAESAILGEFAPYAKDFASGIIEAAMDDTPKVRSTGGSTSVCLARVQQDFKDFHAEDADTDIKTFILEFLHVKYCGQTGFGKAKVSNRVLLNIGDKSNAPLTNIKINQIAISDYKKSLNSATLKYRVSVGFTQNGARQEKLYEIEYTLQLRDEYDSMTFIKCENCGAPLTESDGVCPYCGMKHIRDTISSWVVTDVLEK